jgi:hypothetical protein
LAVESKVDGDVAESIATVDREVNSVAGAVLAMQPELQAVRIPPWRAALVGENIHRHPMSLTRLECQS